MDRGRVVLFSDAPYFGGAEGYLVYLAEGLRRRGWDPVALIPEPPEGEVLGGRFRDGGFAVETFRLRPWMSPAMARHLLGKLKRLAGDVLHVNLPSPYEGMRNVVGLWGRMAGYARVVATEHLPMSLRARRRALLKTLLEPAFDAYIVMTRSGAVDLHERHAVGRGRIVLIPYGIHPLAEPEDGEREAFLREMSLPEDVLLIGHVGALTARKGHRFFLDALDGLRPRLEARNARVLFIGSGEEEESLIRQRDALGLNGAVRFLGYRDDARRIIGLLDLLVLPSIVETQPFVILEAMSAGTPVLSTTIYGIPDMVVHEETGLLAPPGDAAALTRALDRFLADDDFRKRMGRRGKARYEKLFTLERMTEETLRVYRGDAGVAA